MRAESAYWDASAVVPLCCHQPASASVRRLARQRRKFVVWWGTAIEARSALRRLLRDGALSETGYLHATNRLDLLRRSWSEILPTEEIRNYAQSALELYDIRAADAFQLAAALVWCDGKPRRRPFICFDERLARAAIKAGFEVP
jgi:predicted nucleic acid-binding protein